MAFPIYLFKPYPQASLDFVLSQCGSTAFLARHFGSGAVAVTGALLSLAAAITVSDYGDRGLGASTAAIVFSLWTILSGVEQVVEVHSIHKCRSVDLTGALMCSFLIIYLWRPKMKLVFQPTLDSA